MWATPLWTTFFSRFLPFFTPMLLLPHPPDRPLAFTEQGVPRPPRRGLFPCHPTLSVFRALPWPVPGIRAEHSNNPATPDHSTFRADRFDRRFHFHGRSALTRDGCRYLNRYVIRPRVRS